MIYYLFALACFTFLSGMWFLSRPSPLSLLVLLVFLLKFGYFARQYRLSQQPTHQTSEHFLKP